MYSISSDGTFTIKIKNINDPTQWWYMIELKDVSGNRLLLEKAFCTNQPLATFSVNNGQYVSHTTTNEFIIYE